MGLCPVKAAERRKRYEESRKDDPEYRARRRESARKWSAKNKERIAAKTREKRQANQEAHHDYRLRYYYGIGLDQYNLMLEEQGHKCAICAIPKEQARDGRLVVDHVHATGRIRSLLCHKCNSALGLLRDDPDLIDAAASYVRKHAAH